MAEKVLFFFGVSIGCPVKDLRALYMCSLLLEIAHSNPVSVLVWKEGWWNATDKELLKRIDKSSHLHACREISEEELQGRHV